MSDGPAGATSLRRVRERPDGPPATLYVLAEWEDRWPGLRAGVTGAGPEADYGLSTVGSALRLLDGYQGLAGRLGFGVVVVPRQVHGSRVVDASRVAREADAGAPGSDREPGEPALLLPGRADGAMTSRPGVLLAVTAADCVPVYVSSPDAGVVALLHAGWRGVAAGVLEAGLRSLRRAHDLRPEDLHVHLGVAICGACYEVGPEVMEALGRPAERRFLDLREELAGRALAHGIGASRLTVSAWCTRCDADRFHSHRGSGGAAGRMAAYVGRARQL